MGRPANTPEKILARLVRDGNGCLIWPGKTRSDGYVRVSIKDESLYLHVLAYVTAKGPLSEDQPVVRHTCDVRRCGEPTHLIAGTQADNVTDRHERGRDSRGSSHSDALRGKYFPSASALRGSASPRAKLTDDQVRYILSAESRTERTGLLAARLKVSRKTISQIRKGERWPHLHSSGPLDNHSKAPTA